MDEQNNKSMIKRWIAAGIGVVVIALVAVFWIWPRFMAPAPSGNPAHNSGTPGGGEVPGSLGEVTSPKSAYDIATARAKLWQPDAALVKVLLGNASGGQWTFVFVSQKDKGKGFQVVVDGQAVLSANEIVFEGSGTPLPTDIISPDAVMAQAHSLPGYGTVAFVSLEMIYNAAARQWYWGIKTSDGTTLTIKATP